MELEGERIDVFVLEFKNKGLLCCVVYTLNTLKLVQCIESILSARHSFRLLGLNSEQNKDQCLLKGYILVAGIEGMQASAKE